MLNLSLRPSLLVPAMFALFSVHACFADTINLGFVQFIMGSDTTAGFNVLNETGPNSAPFPDTSFPVVTPVSFLNLTLVVNFANGTTESFLPASGYFSLAGDNLSFMGQQRTDFFANPISSATLSGMVGATDLVLNSGFVVGIGPAFSSSITDPLGSLVDGDFSLITGATAISEVPEPGMIGLVAIGMAALGVHRLRGRLRVA